MPAASAQTLVTVRPAEIDDVLVNPGIGFMTFQRANGDAAGSTGRSKAVPGKDYPQVSMDYLRVYWNFFEPEDGKYRWILSTTRSKPHTTGGRPSCSASCPMQQ